MKVPILWLAFAGWIHATTLTVVPVYEPLSLRATDVDDLLDESEEALQATVMARPMALSGAFPETMVEAVATPHRFPTNDPEYVIEEVNLLVICRVSLSAWVKEDGLHVIMDLSKLSIPDEVDLTARQLVRLGLLAVRRTLEEYQRPQAEELRVFLSIDGTTLETESLKELGTEYVLKGA
ncbi:hypothetical protein HNR46_002857 [Haloferula luteola]|uniref:Uncharacterized protein n=1 Tax=Haloferula luteola TaxID=595692 RepID=A0A840VFL4_9BACT|nr:hypothetical protein [Haloferula luteola]MBB5352609.1 hypothetical protein [Haloferula luteola]